MVIYKVLRHDEFLALEKERETFGSSKDISDGFIHFSTREQIRETLEKHYNVEQRLVLMAVEVDRIVENLKWEKSRSDQIFPHLYAKLDFNSAVWFAPIEFSKNKHILPPGI